MAPTAGSPEEASCVREENESLRSDNIRLRAAVAAARPETPAEWEVPPTPNSSGGAMLAAESLVHLMQEGGNLLAEREALRLENEALEIELLNLVDDYEDEEIGSYVGSIEGTYVESVGGSAAADDDGEDVGDEIDDATLEKLLPLLSEGDALRAEREGLRAERRDLLGALETAGAAQADEAIDVTAADEDLEQRFLVAVQDVRSENANLESEISKLREENTRLKRRGSTPRVPPQSFPKVAPPPAADTKKIISMEALGTSERKQRRQPLKKLSLEVVDEDWDSAQIRQKEAMATLLRSVGGAVSPSSSTLTMTSLKDSRRKSPASTVKSLPALPEIPESDDGKTKGPPDMSQEQAIKGALHTLFRTLAK